MADDQADPLKAELERRKLQLEIAELERPWWRKPPSLALFLPLVAALLSIIVGWRTGFFDNQRLVLEAQRHDLASQTRELRLEERGLQGKKAELTEQVKQLETTLAGERDKARAEREKMAADRRDEKAKAGKETAALKRTVDEAREAARRTPAVVWLDVMKRKKEPWQLVDTSNAAEELLTVLNGDRSLAPLVATEYEKHSGDDLIASKLLRVLYAATGDAQWLEKIAAKLGEASKAQSRVLGSLDLSSLYGSSENSYWRESVLLRLRKRDLSFLEKALKLATSGVGDRAQRGATVISLANSFEGEFDRRAFSTEESYFALLRLARDHASVRSYPWQIGIPSVYSLSYARQQALQVLARLSAEGAITIFAVLIMMAPEQYPSSILTLPGVLPSVIPGSLSQSPERAQLEGDFRYRLTDKAFRAEAVRLGLVEGESDAPKWQEWIRNHQNLVAEWAEPDLAKVRQRLSRKSP
jgi:hypothetical protein